MSFKRFLLGVLEFRFLLLLLLLFWFFLRVGVIIIFIVVDEWVVEGIIIGVWVEDFVFVLLVLLVGDVFLFGFVICIIKLNELINF